MIDNYPQTMKLIEKMKAQLPIPVQASPPLVHQLSKQGVKLKSRHKLIIVDVFYLGDEGGIACALKGTGGEEVGVVTSITHLVIEAGHALALEVRAYQTERTRKLAGY